MNHAKALSEKCPTCTEKCEWYFKNRVLPKALSLEDSLMLNELPNNFKTRRRY
jgi:hypothetical protein